MKIDDIQLHQRVYVKQNNGSSIPGTVVRVEPKLTSSVEVRFSTGYIGGTWSEWVTPGQISL